MDVLHWPGGRNVRDLGGRALRSGGCTPFGKVFRSAAPEHLTDEGWAAAKAAGVRTMVDLRNAPAETQRLADHPVISAESLHDLIFVPAPIEDPDDTEFLRGLRTVPGSSALLGRQRTTCPRPHLRRSARGRPGRRGGARALRGRPDRTGMISAMLLHIVGATEHAIIDDYVAGWRGAAAHAGHAWV